MSKKLDQLIKSLKEAKDILNKDDTDEKIKAKLLDEMKRRNFGESDAIRHVIDRDRGNAIPKPKKPKEPLLQSEDMKIQEAKMQAVKQLTKKEEIKPEPVKKSSALDLADKLIKSLSTVGGLSKSEVGELSQRRPIGGQVGWSQDPATGAFHHKLHGVVLTTKEPSGAYSVKHNGKVLGTYKNINAAGAKVKEHIGSFNSSAKTVIKEDGSMEGDSDPVYKSMDAAQKAEQLVMDKLAKTVGAMMPQNAKLQPTQEEFEAAMIAQGIAFAPEQLEKMEKDYQTGINSWFADALKPISQRFSSEEEEEAYWANIKVNSGPDNGPGY